MIRPKFACLTLLICGVLAQHSVAQILYSTGFEPPAYTVGNSPAGVDQWANGSGTGAGMTVSSTQALGSQSLQSDNTSLSSFYSVRHVLDPMSQWNGTDPLEVSVSLWIDPSTEVNRLYGMILGSTATSTLGGTVLGLTVGGDGSVRAGTVWSNTYTNSGLLGTISDFTGQWMKITLGYDPGTGEKTASVSGTFGTVGSSFFGGAAPANINLGTDYFATTDRAGIAYFDNLVVFAVPEPTGLSLLSLLGLSGLALRRRLTCC